MYYERRMGEALRDSERGQGRRSDLITPGDEVAKPTLAEIGSAPSLRRPRRGARLSSMAGTAQAKSAVRTLLRLVFLT